MFKLCLTIVFLAGMQLHLSGQCPGNALWLNGENDGIMKDTALIGGSVMVYASTSGTMTNGRPLYRTTGSVWKGLHYGGLQVWRAYSSIGSNYTSFKLSAPLDSNFIHLRVDNIRGDFPNMESQHVRGYYQGTAVPASFKDPVNGAYNSGNTIHGGSSTNSSTQSAMRVFFHAAVDSIVIQQSSFSDWIIAELMVECNYLLPRNLHLWTAEKNNDRVMMHWETSNISPTQYYQVERSVNGIEFYPIEQVNARPLTSTYTAFDRSPATGKNHYRLKTVYGDGHADYSDIITINWSHRSVPFGVFPNPATTSFQIRVARNVTTLTIYSMDGRKMLMRGPVATEQQVNTSHWPRGEYIIRAEWPGGSGTEKIIVK